MKSLENIKGIFFDLGGTLLYPPSGNWVFSAFARQYFPAERIASPQGQAVYEQAHASLEADHRISTIQEEAQRFETFYTTLSQALGLGLTQEELRLVTEDKVNHKQGNYRLFDDTLDTLKALHGKYRLGIISDTWPSIVPLLEYFDILKYFDFATYSYELGVFKPDPRMYQDALAKMGLPAGETLFVDDRACNLLAAQEQGIHPVLITAMPGVERREDLPCIGRISGLLDLLGAEGRHGRQ